MNIARQFQFEAQSVATTRGAPSGSNTCCLNPGESLLRLGRLVRFLVRHGAELRQEAKELGLRDKLCVLATRFLAAPYCLQLRALVEDWSLTSIQSTLAGLERNTMKKSVTHRDRPPMRG